MRMDNPFSITDERLENIEKCLAKIMSVISEFPVSKSTAETNISFTIDELAKYLGVTKATIHSYKRNYIFPYYQTGRTVYFKKEEVDAALSSGRKKKP